MFIRKQGKTKFMWLPVTVSTILSLNSIVAWDAGSVGKLIAATSGTQAYYHVGVVRHAITAADDDYAIERLIEVEVPIERNVLWEADVTSGLIVADRGLYVDLTNSTTLDRTASTEDVAQVIKYISATKCYCILNLGGEGGGAVA